MNHNACFAGDPNSPKIYRIERIIEECRGKSVLHLGFVQHADVYREKIQQGKWLHNRLAEVATRIVGLDYLSNEVDIIRDTYGYECYYADVTKLEDLQTNEQFDVIVCGELIEHLSNFGLMLDGVKRFMHDRSVMVITTPNIWSALRIRLIRNGVLESSWMNQEHTCAFTYGTLSQLLTRHGYKETDYNYTYAETISEIVKQSSMTDRLKTMIKKLILKRTPYRLWDGLFFVASLRG